MPSRTVRNARSERLLDAVSVAFPSSLILLVVSFLLVGSAAAAQSRVKGRLLDREEGLAVVEAISEHRAALHARGPKPDCSHLVNDVYNLAGFAYAYAKSSDLYRGTSTFERVKFPQLGDLIVWRGHVGLVTDPHEHLFYSSLRSGLDTEDYTSAYWAKHGTPRFYRYRIMGGDPFLMTHATVHERDEESESSFRTLSVRQLTRDDEDKKFVTGGSADTARGPVADAGISMAAGSTSIGATSPSEILITAGRDKPTVEQANLAISKLNQTLASTADAETLLRSASPIVIVTNIQVNRLQFKGNHGWAYIILDSGAYLQNGDLEKAARHDEEHWEILRTKSGWKMMVPSGTIYLSRVAAARIFAQRLARLTENRSSGNSVTAEESSLASLLNSLLNN